MTKSLHVQNPKMGLVTNTFDTRLFKQILICII